MLAHELGRRGIGVLLVDPKEAPRATSRRMPPRPAPWSTTAAWGSPTRCARSACRRTSRPTSPISPRFARHELARFSLPSARDARELVRTLSGSWSAAELPHRCNQKFIEPVLRPPRRAPRRVSVRYGWRMTRFEAFENEVQARVEPSAGGPSHTVRASYLVGADGPKSPTRQALGIRYTGETG
jgi:2-polyprenyl-6-methoxyphenol hydroxylase-like FAD-dependent oxidoreductase